MELADEIIGKYKEIKKILKDSRAGYINDKYKYKNTKEEMNLKIKLENEKKMKENKYLDFLQSIKKKIKI